MNAQKLEQLTRRRGASAIFRKAPSAADGVRVRAHGDVDDAEVRFYLYQDVLSELLFAAEYRDDVSIAILLGNFAIDPNGGPYVEVSGFEEFSYIGASSHLYSNIRPSLERVRAHIGRESGIPERHIVGIFASLPDCAGELTPELARTHLSLFNIPFQVALAFDPDQRQLGAFVRPPGSRFENTPFWTVGAPVSEGDSGSDTPDEPAESLASSISDAVDESR